jgi:hypothetical protein
MSYWCSTPVSTNKPVAVPKSSIDSILGGGWSKSTLNVIMGETNVGKCSHYQTIIKIRNKKTGKIKNLTIGELYNLLKR